MMIMGHRGAAAIEPENTLLSIKKAMDIGVDAVEIDVHLSKDKELIVIHDSTLDRTTSGTGPVNNYTLSELKKYDAGKGESVPTLYEVMKLTDKKIKLVIELKEKGTETKRRNAQIQPRPFTSGCLPIFLGRILRRKFMRAYKIIAFSIILILNLTACLEGIAMDKKSYKKLSKEEERVMVHKGTEAPFSGKYNDFFEKGSYHCKRCNAKLYSSDDKFSSFCGWPSFDDEIKGAIKRKKDIDGKRIEILCANCEAHLGHVFEGEGLTEKNIRHCVNSISMVFVPDKKETNIEKAYFAGGCFWGVEYFFEHKDGVTSAISGYMGGFQPKPTYLDVTSGKTGHLEVVEVTYDSARLNYEKLVKFFFEIHDPTQVDGQGPDIGEQYLSAIFYKNDDEKIIIDKLIDILKTKGYQIVTKVLPATTFWKAEEYHQDYYEKNKQQPYCHVYKRKF